MPKSPIYQVRVTCFTKNWSTGKPLDATAALADMLELRVGASTPRAALGAVKEHQRHLQYFLPLRRVTGRVRAFNIQC